MTYVNPEKHVKGVKDVKSVTRASVGTAAGVAAIVLLAGVIAAPVAAQIPVGTKVGEPLPSAGSYESLGRRDPFVSLIAPRRATSAATPRMGTGLQSFLVDDVIVTGISRKGDLMMAILQSADKQSYVAKIRDRLSNAVVKSIDSTGVVFVEVGESSRTGRPREIRKLLRSADEVNR
jgi:hypothetical protein